MTPYEIKLLLDIYSVADWYEGRNEPIFSGTISDFENQGLVITYGALSKTKLTAKGKAHVSQLCHLPYPQEIKQWADHLGNHIPIIN